MYFDRRKFQAYNNYANAKKVFIKTSARTNVVPAKSDSDVLFCLQLLSKTLTCSLHLS